MENESKSVMFCKSEATNPERVKDFKRDWQNGKISCFPSEPIFKAYLSSELLGKKIEKGFFNIKIDFSDNADFQYFTQTTYRNDGAFMSTMMAIDNIVSKIINAQSWSKDAKSPKLGDTLHYVLGDFVILDENSKKFATKQKPWLTARTTVMLPIFVEILEG